MQFIAKYLTNELIKNNIITSEDYEVYKYGMELILSTCIIFLCILLTSFIFKKLILGSVFLITLTSLRAYSGGYHANSYKKCFCLSCGAFVLSLIIVYLQQHLHLKYSLITLNFVATLYLLKIGSLNSSQTPKTFEEMQLRKMLVRLFTIIYNLISSYLILFLNAYIDIAVVIVCVQIYASVAVWIIERNMSYEK